MNIEERRSAIKAFRENHNPVMTGISIVYKGERRTFDAYAIPLNLLTYNPYNGRIGAEVKSFEKQNHVLDVENADDVKIIEKFLWESKLDANKKTMDSLLKNHQEKFGIVTASGMIIDGNRRASLLNRIFRDSAIPFSDKAHTQYFLGIILPDDADKKEILRLETTYQMGEDVKVDYGPIEKYLKAKDLKAVGFTSTDIADFMGVQKKDVEQYLRVMDLMDEYLQNFGYDGIYTMLDKNEDSFIKLEAALKGYKAGNVAGMWGYDVESDVSDLKTIAFDYIRLDHDQTDFRNLIRKPKRGSDESSFFANEHIWRDFCDRHFEIIDEYREPTVEELREDNPNEDLAILFKNRDKAWKDHVGGKLEASFERANDELKNKQQSNQPLKLLEKAVAALESVDTTQNSFKNDANVRDAIEHIQALLNNLEKDL